jgi:hypothetical protein
MQRPLGILVATVLALQAQTAGAWSRQGHMLTAAVAYEDLAANDPQLLAKIDEIMGKHPDRGAFEVAGGPPKSEAHLRRVFLEMARWPDDVRSTPFDHPTWHNAGRPVIDKKHPPVPLPADVTSGAAAEAYALNLRMAADKGASAAERAVSLCWVMHLVGDIHQPLHSADEYTAALPDGDRGGNSQFIRDPRNGELMNLHAYWDGIVRSSGEVPEVTEQARSLAARLPRSQFPQLKTAPAGAGASAAWANEAYQLAQKVAYRGDLETGAKFEEGKTLTDAYVAESTATGERQIVLAGYRIADVLRSVFATTR